MEIKLADWVRPEGAKERYRVRAVSMLENLEMMKIGREFGEESPEMLTFLLDKLIEWEGVTIGGKKAACTVDNAVFLPAEHLGAITGKVMELSGLTGEQEKNSPSPSTSPSTGDLAASTAAIADTANIATKPARHRSRTSKSPLGGPPGAGPSRKARPR